MKDKTESAPETGKPARTLETVIFDASPLGFRGTALALFLLPASAYAGLAALTGFPLLEAGPDGGMQADGTLIFALLLSAIFAAAVSLAAASARPSPQVRSALALTLKDGMEAVDRYERRQIPRARRNVIAVLAGLIIGLGINIYPIGAFIRIDLADYIRSPGVWFLVMSPILFALLVRAILSMSEDGPVLRALARDQLIVDLDHPDRLHVYGRMALRSALSWLVFAAIGIAFLGTGASWNGALPMMVGAALLAGASFFLAMRAVHDRMAETRAAALDAVRDRLADMRTAALSGDREAMSALSGLTSYEARLERLGDWPVSAPVTTRFALYVLIPVLAWIGAALAERLVGFLTT